MIFSWHIGLAAAKGPVTLTRGLSATGGLYTYKASVSDRWSVPARGLSVTGGLYQQQAVFTYKESVNNRGSLLAQVCQLPVILLLHNTTVKDRILMLLVMKGITP